MKALKILTLPITFPIVFLVTGAIGAWSFAVLLFDKEKKDEILNWKITK